MSRNRAVFLAGGALVLAALAVYANTLSAPFVFDDLGSILENPSIRHLWPPGSALSPPRGTGATVDGRPLINLSLAVNYAISGTNVWSYHGFNMVVHALAGLTLFGLVRRTLMRPAIPEKIRTRALSAAFVTALLWTLHPLQTESVTYTIQRAESLMGLFYLFTLYGFVRATEESLVEGKTGYGRRRAWLALSIVACLFGAGCKEVIATAPVIVLLYDRVFVAGTFSMALRVRWKYYVGLALVWLPLTWLTVSTGGDRGGTFALTMASATQYWLTQIEAVTRYVGLSIWPHPLVFDYGVFAVSGAAGVLPYVLAVAVLLTGTGWLWLRRPAAGFAGVAFFLILAPTSLMPGVSQVIVEHRMYLPLAALAGLVVAGGTMAFGSRGVWVLCAISVAAGVATVRRNFDYRSPLVLWNDTVAKRPQSSLARSNLAQVHYERGELAAAVAQGEEALRLSPQSPRIHYNLGLAFQGLGRNDEAERHFRAAIAVLPQFAQAHDQLAKLLTIRRDYGGALEHATHALRSLPDSVATLRVAGEAMSRLGHWEQAAAVFERALVLEPANLSVEGDLSAVLIRLGRTPEAVRRLETAVGAHPRRADLRYNLGLALTAAGRMDAALEQYVEAVRIDPALAEARLNLGVALAQEGRFPDALPHLREAVRLQPGLAEAHGNLGIVLSEGGRPQDALDSFREALRLRPDYPEMHYNLGNALLRLGQQSEARQSFTEAFRLAPGFEAAREMLERLRDSPSDRR